MTPVDVWPVARSSRNLPLRVPESGPWQWKQLALRIGRMCCSKVSGPGADLGAARSAVAARRLHRFAETLPQCSHKQRLIGYNKYWNQSFN